MDKMDKKDNKDNKDRKALFPIGDVAKLFHISVSSLRHYEDEGLLTPEYTDPDSGYRYYGARQFEVLNSIRYLRTLDMPLAEIADFLGNRDVARMKEKLLLQRDTVMQKQAELQRIARKIDNRLRMIEDAETSVFDTVFLTQKDACRMVFVRDSLQIHGFLDMEAPIRKLEREQTEATVFLGKVGVAISPEHLTAGQFARYDGIFLLLDAEDRFTGEVTCLEKTLAVTVRFHGSHTDAPAQYRKLLAYIDAHKLGISGFSREITMVDYGITSDTDKFVTEISIPVCGT